MSFLWRRNEIKNSRIIYDHKLEDIEITLIQSDNFNNEVFYDLIPKLKHEQAEGIVEKIIELNDKYLKIKDGYGDITTYIRL
jgi:hypothetical protein